MAIVASDQAVVDSLSTPASTSSKAAACDALIGALNSGGIGEMVAKHEKLILHYYEDVQGQAKQSFQSATSVAKIGFVILGATLAYVVLVDLMAHLEMAWFKVPNRGVTVGLIGMASGGLVEFIAGINFVLYSRASKQFGAFHICLERTHRYLVAYKIVETMHTMRDETFEKLVCIMASAPMITRQDIEGASSGAVLLNPPSANVGAAPAAAK
jgi:hypothetical protein